jgi:hypothetical protein
MKSLILVTLLSAVALPGPAMAQPSSGEREKIRQIIVYGADPCPRGTGKDIVVCARRPESERYRIPKGVREPEETQDSESWANKAERLEMVGRTGIQSCSPVGPGGATGCLEQFIKQSRDERRANAQEGNAP